MMVNKLFTKHPSEIFTHPQDFPTDPKEIKEGPIEGWECYAPVYGTLQCIKCEPVVVYEFGEPCIKVKTGNGGTDGETFWYGDGSKPKDWRPSYPCWFQSGSTLRFIKKS